MFGIDLNKFHLAGYGVALAIIAYLLFNPRVEHVPIEYEEDKSLRDTTEVTRTVTDTVTVYDTTYVSLEIPKPVTKDSLKEYTTNYSDPFITARITSKVEGLLINQNLWYLRKVDYIKTTNISNTTIDRYLKPTRVFEDPNRNNPKGLWIGANTNFNSVTPTVTLFNQNIAYEVGYNLSNESLNNFELNALRIGAKIKLF